MPTRMSEKRVSVICGALVIVVFLRYAVFPSTNRFLHTARHSQRIGENRFTQTDKGRVDLLKYSNISIGNSAVKPVYVNKAEPAVRIKDATYLIGQSARHKLGGDNISVSHINLTPVSNSSFKRHDWISETKKPFRSTDKKYVPLYRISPKSEFPETLSKAADSNRTVIISVVDDSVKYFALNFYYSSVAKFDLHNHVFVCTDLQSRAFLASRHIPCFYYDIPFTVNLLLNGSTQTADFGSRNYLIKTNMKTLIVLDALQSNFSVLIVDVDIVFFKNPFPYLTCSECDLHISMDRELRNSGFVFAKSSRAAMQLYQQAWDYFMQYHKSHDQSYVNMALKVMLDNGAILIKEFSGDQFPCGYYYFQSDFRMFNNSPPCTQCVLVHNNYIGSTAAKVYRFRENQLWTLDEDHYYSNVTQKFLMYENPPTTGMKDQEVIEKEMLALKNAMILGTALNRLVILPTFSCCDCNTWKCHKGKFRCSLLSVVRLKTFDEEYKGRYREHSFMWNNRVPAKVRDAKQVEIDVKSSSNGTLFSSQFLPSGKGRLVISLDTKDKTSNAQNLKKRENFLQWLELFKDQTVIKFSTLPVNFRFVQSNLESFYYDQHEQISFQCSSYDQWSEHLQKF